MHTRVKITIGRITIDAELFDTPCAKAISGALPLEAMPNEWGDKFYFEIAVNPHTKNFGVGVKMPLDKTATTKVKIGDIGYWPPGNALAIFFGPTPTSRGSDPVTTSEVNLLGRIIGNATILRKAKEAGKIRFSL